MANFLIVVDPDGERRSAFCRVARGGIAPVDGLVLGECGGGDLSALWACGPQAPVAQSTDGGSATVIWGLPGADGDGHRIGPAELAALWSGAAAPVPAALNGYFAAVHYTPARGLVVGADLLGLYPVFWWQSGKVLLAGSSPELFRHHPLFRFELDLAGLTGILLTMYSVEGRTLMTGVSRLGPGRALVWPAGAAPREVTQYQLPASTRYFDLPGSVIPELVNETLRGAVARHVPRDGGCALTLTGGRDSRLLAGIMVDLGRPPVTVTLGRADDYEMRCALAVARSLGLEHHGFDMHLDRQVTCPELNARWLHCTSGFNSSDYWYCQEDLRGAPPALVTGFVMGSIVGGSHFDWAYSESTREMSFENFLSSNNQYAIRLDQLRRLLRPELFGTLVEETIELMRQVYENYSELESQRAWCFDLHYRQRFHVGTPPWQFSFGSWPITPVIDKELLKVAGGIPAGVIAGRRVQDEILRTYYPALAELPLDRNGFDTTPLSPRLRYRIRANLLGRIAPMTRRLRRGRGRGPEHRFYYRVLDFNGPDWRAARRRAEPHRAKLHDLFDNDVLDEMLPGPEVEVAPADGIVGASGMRLLTGLCLWAGANL